MKRVPLIDYLKTPGIFKKGTYLAGYIGIK